MDDNQLLFYETQDGETRVEVLYEGETVWLTQLQLAQLLQRDKSVISKHIKNILDAGELDGSSMAKIATVQTEGGREVKRDVEYYNLDMIISVAYRVNSHRGTQFRIWATKTLREYIVKGFVIDDDRLSGGRTNYFEELLERVRGIRTSEKNFYDKVKAIFTTSIDYNPQAEAAKQFYGTVQNKFHYAIHGHTAAELIVERINSGKQNMGLTNWKGEIITRKDAEVAKNYLEELELRQLELLVEQFLSFAELKTLAQKPMYMADWIRKLDEFIVFNERKVLSGSGTVSRKAMEEKVREQLAKFNEQTKTNPRQLNPPAQEI